jgi:hypothetical protein
MIVKHGEWLLGHLVEFVCNLLPVLVQESSKYVAEPFGHVRALFHAAVKLSSTGHL